LFKAKIKYDMSAILIMNIPVYVKSPTIANYFEKYRILLKKGRILNVLLLCDIQDYTG